ncbi:DUF4185 domain-containing protein [Saccharicrinis sp. FJH2]|uniref:DUF4185 domain-containing protein n=1 Tax=Saccharicrinis sp. FJH65 TaxID=3344659 RepID=UPI0035F2C102
MRSILFLFLILPNIIFAQELKFSVAEIDNTIFKRDNYWRGADGAATVKLANGKILWLFSDSFIDKEGTGKRSWSNTMIRNSIAVQDSGVLNANLTFYYKGNPQNPEDFFKLPGKNWFWTGHGIMVGDKLVVFLFEETATKEGIGFEAVGWYVAVIDNPDVSPDKWDITYHKGINTFGVIVGSSAVLQDETYVYAYGVKEPATHETYLFRIDKQDLTDGNLAELEWWVTSDWTNNVDKEPKSSALFIGQTEFSVHYDQCLKQYIQIQTYGIGKASVGYRLADHLYGPWSEPIIVYTPSLKEDKEFVYTANAHPEFKSDGLIITYNINNGDIESLIANEDIYFPKIIRLQFEKDK